jgi:hypothetical protein
MTAPARGTACRSITTEVLGRRANPGDREGLCGRGLRHELIEAPSSAGFMAARAARFVD